MDIHPVVRGSWAMHGIAVLAMFCLAAAARAAPSFSCAAATTPLEKLICAEPSLAARDADLADAFRDAQSDASGDAAKAALLAAQRQWLGGRMKACPGVTADLPASGFARDQSIECVDRIYQQRIDALLLARNEAAWPHLPFRPSLIEGAGKPICDAMLADIRATFLGPSDMPNPLGEREIGFAAMPGLPADATLLHAEFDPYNSGKPVPVLLDMGDDSGMHLGVSRYRRFTGPAAFEAAMASLRRDPDQPSEVIGMPVFDIDGMRDSGDGQATAGWPSFLTDDPTYMPAMPRFFRYDGKVYVYAPYSTEPGPSAVYQMANPRLARRICRFDAGRSADIHRYEELTEKAGLPELERAATPLMPHGMLCYAVGDAVRTRDDRAMWRPWSLAARRMPSGEADWEMFARYLNNRGLTGLEPAIDYREFVAARGKSVDGLAPYYVSEFGRTPTDARALAALWIDQGLVDEAELDADDPRTKALLAVDYADTHQAQTAALAGDIAALRRALGDDAKAAVSRQRGEYDEPLPTYALQHPDLLRLLLDVGFDPDAFGASGRTPLMTAARLDLADAAEVLLTHGAKPDLAAGKAVSQLDVEDDALCLQAGNPPAGDVPGRTALSYAAENASPALVRLLLAHGADKAQADSAGTAPLGWAAGRDDAAGQEIRSLLGSAQ